MRARAVTAADDDTTPEPAAGWVSLHDGELVLDGRPPSGADRGRRPAGRRPRPWRPPVGRAAVVVRRAPRRRGRVDPRRHRRPARRAPPRWTASRPAARRHRRARARRADGRGRGGAASRRSERARSVAGAPVPDRRARRRAARRDLLPLVASDRRPSSSPRSCSTCSGSTPRRPACAGCSTSSPPTIRQESSICLSSARLLRAAAGDVHGYDRAELLQLAAQIGSTAALELGHPARPRQLARDDARPPRPACASWSATCSPIPICSATTPPSSPTSGDAPPRRCATTRRRSPGCGRRRTATC